MVIWRAAPRSMLRTAVLSFAFFLFFTSLVTYHNRVSGGLHSSTYWSHVVAIPHDAISLSLRESTGNATLGGTKWRVGGLQAAAALTGLTITTPPNPQVEPERLVSFNKVGTPALGNGSATAWISHLNLLRFVIENGDSTALILEDDADWDVSLKNQMKRVSDGVRSLCRRENTNRAGFKTSASPYGDCWDVLWIGHCGDNIVDDTPTWKHPASPWLRMWEDKTVVRKVDYSGFAHNSIMTLPWGMRSVVVSRGPVCTFGYAVTQHAARLLIELAGVGDDQAYDVKLSHICKEGLLKCFSVVPEVIHEYTPPPGEDGVITSEVNAANGQGTKANDASDMEMGTTLNIVKSARCAALYHGSTCFPGRVES